MDIPVAVKKMDNPVRGKKMDNLVAVANVYNWNGFQQLKTISLFCIYPLVISRYKTLIIL